MHPAECIIDVGSASIGLCIAEMKGVKPVISKTVRVAFSDGTHSTDTIATRATQAVQKALESLKGVPSPKRVQVVLAAPWYDGKIRTIVSSSEKQVRVTTDTIGRSVKEYLAQKNEAGAAPGRRIIESVVSQAYINGYPTALKKPIVGTSLKINYYESEADEAFLQSLTDVIKKVFGNVEISFHSFALVSCLALRIVRPEENFIMTDVGGEITDMVVAHHDGLRFIGTFPIGTLSIIRAIAGTGSLADVSSRLILFAKNELSVDEMLTMEKTFETATAEWGKAYQTLLETAVKEVGIPQTTFLFGDKEELKWLTRLVSGSHGMFSSRATPVVPEFLQNAVSLGEGGIFDSFLNLESLYFHSRKQGLIDV